MRTIQGKIVDVIVEKSLPDGGMLLICPRYDHLGNIDIEATAKHSVVVYNIGKTEDSK